MARRFFVGAVAIFEVHLIACGVARFCDGSVGGVHVLLDDKQLLWIGHRRVDVLEQSGNVLVELAERLIRTMQAMVCLRSQDVGVARWKEFEPLRSHKRCCNSRAHRPLAGA